MSNEPADPTTAAPVVVAIDDSDAGRAALSWAAAHARMIHAELQVVHVLQYAFGDPVTWAPGLLGAPHTASAGELDFGKHQLQELFAATEPEPSWSLRFLDGPTGRTIITAAHDAQLLVVGARGHHGLERLLVGSVSHYCLTHASCPVLTVPAPDPTPAQPVAAAAAVLVLS